MMMSNSTYDTQYAEVLVFKTNVSSDKDIEKVTQRLSSEKNITRWNIDRDDIDKVLRIECDRLQPAAVIRWLHDVGFECEELPD